MEIREFNEEDEGAIRNLFALCFGKELSHEEWAWKYKGSPWGSNAVVAINNGSIIAHYGGLRMKFYFRGKTFDVFQPCDVMTHPKYRARIFSKKGAMVRAGEYFYETNKMDFAFGFPSERHAILGTKQLGYTEHGYVTVLSRKVSGFSPSLNPLLKVEKGWDFINRGELDALCEKIKDNQGLSIEKNSNYIFWRYKDNPVKQYNPLIVRGRYKKTLKAFAVFSVSESELSILDFFCSTLDIRILFRLFGNIAIKYGLKAMKVWVNPKEEVSRIFIANGFTSEKGIPYIFKIMNNEIDPLFLFENYYYRMGDYDAS
ncbi:MAG: GNAT family N-acetyltransferase [Nitrospirota bacterium]